MSKQGTVKVKDSLERLQNQLEQAKIDGNRKQQDMIQKIINCLKTKIK